MKTRTGCLTIIVATALMVWVGVKASNYARSPEGRAAAARREAEAEVKRQQRAAREAADKQAATRAAQAQADAREQLKRESETYLVEQVVEFYAENEVAGDEAMKGKVLKVRGRVDRVGKDLMNKPYVAFKGADDSIRTVQCFFPESRAGQISSLRAGEQVVVFGTCKGLMMNVLMDDCELVQ